MSRGHGALCIPEINENIKYNNKFLIQNLMNFINIIKNIIYTNKVFMMLVPRNSMIDFYKCC